MTVLHDTVTSKGFPIMFQPFRMLIEYVPSAFSGGIVTNFEKLNAPFVSNQYPSPTVSEEAGLNAVK